MADLKTLVEREMDRAGEPAFAFADLDGLRVRRRRTRRITAAVVGLGLVVALSFVGARIYRSASVPADHPEEPRIDLGIFEPVAGRIVYFSKSDLWAVDPNAPSRSTLVRVDLEGMASPAELRSFTMPLGWSSDGTELLFEREDPTDEMYPYDRYLYILHADGTQTQVVPEPVGDAAISPDGSRVVFAYDGSPQGLYVVDADGGQPVQIADTGASPTFSPDGTQIAYLSLPTAECCVAAARTHVWVANADGTDAHEILTHEPAVGEGAYRNLTWSPAGDRIAIENQGEGQVAIYTFAPDGSDFTKVITDGFNANWSPDGSRIAYMMPYDNPPAPGRPLAIADADGSNIQVFNFGHWGPWHPGTLDDDAAGPSAEPSLSAGMWPQTSLDEVRHAQELADAGDPIYSWQVDPRLTSQESDPMLTDPALWSYFNSGGAGIAERFIREGLGWDDYLFSGEAAALNADGLRGLVYVRCATGDTNPLYPSAPTHRQAPRGDRCAPTIDDLRYEAVRLDLIQPDRQGSDGIWVVKWTATPFAQADPNVVEAEATAHLEEFLRARIDGEGAEGFVEVFDLFGGSEDVPLLYATTTGAPYERSEIELVEGPYWPHGEMSFKVRLFAENGETVVEQLIDVTFEDGRLTYRHDVAPATTTEDGQPLPAS